jgi:hypothetical protein
MLTFSAKGRPRARQPDNRLSPGRGLAPLSSSPSAEEPPQQEDVAPPKGWHDSSSDLKRGLHVVENVPLDSLPAELRDGLSRRR